MHVDVLASSRAQEVPKQCFSPWIVLKDLNACPTRLGRNERQNGTHRQSFFDLVPSPDVLYL